MKNCKFAILFLFFSTTLLANSILSKEELQYLQTKQSIKMCVDPDWLPFENINNNQHTGIIADIYQEFQKSLTIPIKLVVTKNWNDSLKLAQTRECDILSVAAATPQRKKYLNFTKSYLQFPQVIVTREKEPFIENFEDILDKKIGVKKGAAIEELIKRKYPNINLVYISGIEDALYKVSSGELYGFVNTTATLGYAMSKYGMTDLKIASKVGIDYHLKIGVRNDDIILLNIMNKLIDTVDKKAIKLIKEKWLKIKVESFVNYNLIYKIIILFAFVLLGTLYWNRRLKKEIKKRVLIEKKLETSISRLDKIIQMSDTQQKAILNVNEDLEKAKLEAQEANKIKSDFLAKMSHELRTPMNAVLGMLYLLEKTELNSTQENYIQKSNSAAQALLDLINDILDFSKIEANSLELKLSEFNLHKLITDNLSIMSVEAQKNRLELLAFYDKQIPINVIGDKLRIGQVLKNLISNAIKFTQNGEVLVSSKLINIDKDIATIMFCIKDSGCGISNANQQKLFQEFSQVDNSATRSFQGTGLGLAISAKLSNLLGGKVWLEESKEDIGSTFCFTIKIEISQNQFEVEYEFAKEMQNLSVLVVDDNNIAIEVLTHMLESFNYNVTSVTNGKDAIEKVNKNNFDIIFLDYKMPNMNGLETFKELKRIHKEKLPKTIMITAYSHDIINHDIDHEGIKGYINKPISPSILYNKIIEVLSNKKPLINATRESNQTETNFNGFKVLLVEDNYLNQEFTTLMLKKNGFEVDIACDGIESLQKIKSKDYDVVLMDIQMPNMDGLEATRKIRQFNGDYFQNIPIIALSANALVGDKEKSIEAGMDEHITKPINPKQLFNTLANFLNIDSIEQNIDNIKIKSVYKLNQNILDTKDALVRICGDEDAYIKILHQFKIKYRDILDDIKILREKSDIDSLYKKVHEAKGVAGNISAKPLFLVLSSMNTTLKNNKIPTNEVCEEFQQQMEKLFSEIDKLDILINTKNLEFDTEKVTSLLNKISMNLEHDIVISQEYLQEVIPYLQDNHKVFSDELVTFIEEFDTEYALILIEKFLKDLNNDN